jgi:hypothetical protein
MAEELAAALAHSGLRLGEYAAGELQVLGKVVQSIAGAARSS